MAVLPRKVPETNDLLPEGTRSVLLVRLSARGDVAFSAPIVRLLREARPDLRIGWVTETASREFIEAHPDLDDVIVWDRGAWKKRLKAFDLPGVVRSLLDLRRRLRRGRWDVAVDMQGLLRSAFVSRLSGAPMRIGLGSKELSWMLMSHLVERGGDERLFASEYRHLAEQMGLDTSEWPTYLHLSGANRDRAAELLQGTGVGGRFAVFVPFTTRPQKHWFEDRWADLLVEAPRRTGLPVVVLGGPADRAALERIVEQARRAEPDVELVDLVGRTTLGEAAAIVERASLLIGVDTGLTHVGSAFERPTVCLWGAQWPYTLPPAPTTRILFHPLDCAPCRGHPTCEGRFTCMRLISVPQVLSAIDDVLRRAA